MDPYTYPTGLDEIVDATALPRPLGALQFLGLRRLKEARTLSRHVNGFARPLCCFIWHVSVGSRHTNDAEMFCLILHGMLDLTIVKAKLKCPPWRAHGLRSGLAHRRRGATVRRIAFLFRKEVLAVLKIRPIGSS